MGIYSLTFFGAAPIGALMAGAAADRVGEPTTILLSALVPLAYAAWLWLRAPQLRRLQ
jgi:fucose permease